MSFQGDVEMRIVSASPFEQDPAVQNNLDPDNASVPEAHCGAIWGAGAISGAIWGCAVDVTEQLTAIVIYCPN
jgi:hypothetical protein